MAENARYELLLDLTLYYKIHNIIRVKSLLANEILH